MLDEMCFCGTFLINACISFPLLQKQKRRAKVTCFCYALLNKYAYLEEERTFPRSGNTGGHCIQICKPNFIIYFASPRKRKLITKAFIQVYSYQI